MKSYVILVLYCISICVNEHCSFFPQYYKEAIELCEQAYGENSHLMGRIYHNFAIYYEDKNEMDKAFDLFYKCYQVRVIFNGPDHPHTHKAISVLREPNYYPIAVQRGITIPAE